MPSVNSDENDMESERCESPHFKNREEYNQAAVYYNDNIMEKILSYIPEIDHRLNMRLVSKRFGNLVETSGVVVPSTSDVLSIKITTLRMRIVMGSFYKCVENDRNSYNYSNMVRKQMMKTLKKMLSTRRIVKKVAMGNSGHLLSKHERFIVTRDLIEHLDNFINLHTLEIFGAVMNQKAVDYLISDECKFKNRIEHITVKEMNGGPWMAAFVNKKLKTLKIGYLHNMKEVIQKIEEFNIMLDATDIKVGDEEDELDQSISTMSIIAKHTQKIDLQLSTAESVFFGHHLGLWENITSLELRYISSFRDRTEEETELIALFKGIAHLRNLEKLSVMESYGTRRWIELGRAVKNMTKLKDFHLRFSTNLTLSTKEFLNLLPLSIEKMTLYHVSFDLGVIEVFTNRFGNNLKNLSITLEGNRDEPCDWLFGPIVSKMKLTKFRLDSIIDCQYIQQFIDNKHMDELSFQVVSIRPEIVQLLEDHFEKYFNDSGYVDISKRKARTD